MSADSTKYRLKLNKGTFNGGNFLGGELAVVQKANVTNFSMSASSSLILLPTSGASSQLNTIRTLVLNDGARVLSNADVTFMGTVFV